MAYINNSLGNVGGSFDQDNIFIKKFITYPTSQFPTIDIVATSFNNLPTFTVGEKEILIINVSPKYISQVIGNIPEIKKYFLKELGKGTYGQDGTQITSYNLELFYHQKMIVSDIEDDPTTQIVDLGWDITDTNISDYVNQLDPSISFQSQDEGYVLIKVINNEVNESYLFLGDGGFYGINDLQTVIEDFQLIPDTIPVQELQDLQSVLNEGSTAYITTPFTLQSNNSEDIRGAIRLDNEGVFIAGQSGGVTINGDNAGVTINVSNGGLFTGGNINFTNAQTNFSSSAGISLGDVSNPNRFKILPTTDEDFKAIFTEGIYIDGKLEITEKGTFSNSIDVFGSIRNATMSGTFFEEMDYYVGLNSNSELIKLPKELLLNGLDFIPLSGTEVGKPIFGDIEIDDAVVIKGVVGGGGYFLGDVENIALQIMPSGEISEGLIIRSTNLLSKGLLGERIFDKQDDPLAYVQKGDLDNGYIPLSGTLIGSPVTGNIEFEADNGLGLTAKFNDAIYGLALGISSRIYYLDDINNKKVGLEAFENEIVIDSDGTDSKGIIGTRLFDIQNDANAYIQKGYLDAITGDFIPSSEKGQPSGVVPLNSSTKIDALYLPSYVDDVLEFANLSSFPVTGETGKIYVAQNTNKTYRWSGSTYVEISPSDVNSVAGKTGAVTLVIADITSLQTTLDGKVAQNGNSFGVTLDIGTNDNQNVNIKRNGSSYINLLAGDNVRFRDFMTLHPVMGNDYSSIKFNGTGALRVVRNRPDSVSVFEIESTNTSSTGNLLDAKNTSSNIVAGIRNDGRVFGSNALLNNDLTTLIQVRSSITIIPDLTVALNIVNLEAYYGLTGSGALASLPTISGNSGKKITIANKSGGAISIYSNNGTSLDIWNAGTTVNLFSLASGSVINLFNDGVNWVIISKNI